MYLILYKYFHISIGIDDNEKADIINSRITDIFSLTVATMAILLTLTISFSYFNVSVKIESLKKYIATSEAKQRRKYNKQKRSNKKLHKDLILLKRDLSFQMAQSLIFENNMINNIDSNNIVYDRRFVENSLKLIHHLLNYIKLNKEQSTREFEQAIHLIHVNLEFIKDKINTRNIIIENIDRKELDVIKNKINILCGKDAIDEFYYIYKNLKLKNEQ